LLPVHRAGSNDRFQEFADNILERSSLNLWDCQDHCLNHPYCVGLNWDNEEDGCVLLRYLDEVSEYTDSEEAVSFIRRLEDEDAFRTVFVGCTQPGCLAAHRFSNALTTDTVALLQGVAPAACQALCQRQKSCYAIYYFSDYLGAAERFSYCNLLGRPSFDAVPDHVPSVSQILRSEGLLGYYGVGENNFGEDNGTIDP
jgi:hypothetical protein